MTIQSVNACVPESHQNGTQIDPTKVVRIAPENAVSVASILLLTEATMTEIPEDRKNRTAEPEMAL